MELNNKYLAGVFDSRGSVGLYLDTHNAYLSPVFKLQFCRHRTKYSKALFNALKEKYGGNIQEYTINGNPCYPEGYEMITYQLYGQATKKFFYDVLPHIKNKNYQVLVGLHWLKNKPESKKINGHYSGQYNKTQTEYINNISLLLRTLKEHDFELIKSTRGKLSTFTKNLDFSSVIRRRKS